MFDADPLPETRLTVEDISFSYGPRQLFDRLSFNLDPGQILWVTGDNGIGKTTILKLAMGFLKPESGNIAYFSDNAFVSSDQCVGYLGHKDAFEPLLTARETLEFWADIYESDEDLSDIFDQFGLTLQVDQKTNSLSAGQKRRLALARLYISSRPMWIMDEPKAAMDKTGQELTTMVLENHIRRGGSALIASHFEANAIGKNARKLVLEASP